MKGPQLTFFCELPAAALTALFDDQEVIDDLKALNATVGLGLVDLSVERAEVVRALNVAGIPVVAWQLLPRGQGYWYTIDNAPAAIARYAEFQDWTETYHLTWEAVGIDVETDIREMTTAYHRPWAVLPRRLVRLFDVERLRRARRLYQNLIADMRAEGYRVESYNMDVLADDRRAGTTLLQRFFGLVDLEVDRDYLMLYTSFERALDGGLIWSYAPDADAIAVGSTGGGVTLEDVPEAPALTWDELRRDLLLAYQWTDHIGIFSLEGCVRRGHLSRLRDFDWTVSIAPPLEDARNVSRRRRWLRTQLWLGSHPGVVLAGVLGAWWLLRTLTESQEDAQA